MGDDSPRTMKTVEASWEIIHLLERQNEARVTEIAKQLGLSKSTVSTHLATLKQEKYVVCDDGKYRLSLYFLNLGEYVRNRCGVFTAGRSEVERLADETKAYCHLVAEEYGQAIYLHEAQGEHAAGENHFSKKFEKPAYLHSSAYGKAIMAYLPEHRIEEIIDEYDLIQRTDNTITSRKDLFEEMERIRDRGFALNDEEEIRGMRAVGAPILGADDEILGAISASKPSRQMRGEEFRDEMPQKVMSTANVIEVNIDTTDQIS
ncbi:IclR family transcriptional regulator [Halobium palmae]|uniref:IclR family transcriptional regulator n=1 Tax=Halobium palmae TaxID=1776492 RepID=A0ABD5RVI1_9EURY